MMPGRLELRQRRNTTPQGLVFTPSCAQQTASCKTGICLTSGMNHTILHSRLDDDDGLRSAVRYALTIGIIIAALGCMYGCLLVDVIAHQGPTAPVNEVKNVTIPAGDAAIRVRIFTPAGSGPFPILLYSHGGGWVNGNVYTHGKVCRYLSANVGCIVVSVDYRKAPRYKFPTPLEDVYAALRWVAANAAALNGDPARIAVGGDSAGGNLSAAVCLMAKDRGGPNIVCQLLVYPATDLSSLDTESYRKYGSGYGLTKADVEACRDKYLRSPADRTHPYVSPLLATDLSNLPPAFIITGEYDVARDEGEAYAKRLREAGVPARFFRCAGIGHGAASWAVASGTVQQALDEAVAALRNGFGIK